MDVHSFREVSQVPWQLSSGYSTVNLTNLQEGRVASLSDTLGMTPGVFAAPRFGPLDTRLSIRGSGMVRTGHGKGVQLRWGFIPVNQADGNFDVHLLDAFSAATVQVARGGSAFATGNTTLGGSIDYIPLTGQTASPARLRFEAGSFGYRAVNASAAHADENGSHAYGSAGYAKSDGYRRNSDYSGRRATATVGTALRGGELVFLFNYVDVESLWPGALTFDQLRDDPRQAATIAVQRGQGLTIEQILTGLQWTTAAASGRHFSIGWGFNYKLEDHPTPGRILELYTHDHVLDLEFGTELNGGDTRLTLGLRPSFGTGREKRFFYAGPPASAFAAQRGALDSAADRRAFNAVGYAHFEHDITDAWTIDGGVQMVHTERRSNIRSGSPGEDQRFRNERINPRIGLNHSPSMEWDIFAGYSESFEAPTFFDLAGNAGLRPDGRARLDSQTARTFEVGTRGNREGFVWEAVLYRSFVRNELLRLDPAAGFGSPVVNADRIVRDGIELLVSHQINPFVGVTVENAALYNGSWFKFDGDEDFGDNRFAGVPRHRFVFSSNWVGNDKLSFRPSLEHVPQGAWIDNANTVRGPDYTLLHFRCSYQATDRLRVFFDLRNLTDRRHAPTVNVLARANPGDAVLFPGDARSANLGVELRW